MSNPQIRIIDGDTVTDREMTNAEFALWQAQQTTAAAEAEAKEQDDTAKAAARQAVLDKLGLTADEAAALFG